MKKIILYTCIGLLTFSSCKKTPDVPVAIVPERLEISPSSTSMLIGETKSFSVLFYNNIGQLIPAPPGVVWMSLNPSVFSVSNTGVVTGMAAGQAKLKVSYNNAFAEALVSVAANNQQLATISLLPQDILQLTLNQTATVSATGKTNNGVIIPGLSFTWQTNNTNIATVSNQGLVTGRNYGTASLNAMSMGIQSAPLMVQVVRSGTFSGRNSTGKATLKIENGILKLETSADFNYSNAPDLRIYLTNNSSSISGAVEIASLNNMRGVLVWNMPAPITITQYRYILIWCKQFGGNYGEADLGG